MVGAAGLTVFAFEIELGSIPNGLIVTATVIAALGVIWRKMVIPLRDWVRQFKAWMARMETALTWVDIQMKPNGGSTLVDKVNLLLEHDAERDTSGHRYGPTPDNQEDKS